MRIPLKTRAFPAEDTPAEMSGWGMIRNEPDRGVDAPQPGSDHLIELTERG